MKEEKGIFISRDVDLFPGQGYPFLPDHSNLFFASCRSPGLENVNAFNPCAKRMQGKRTDLKELFSEGNSNDRQTENRSQKIVRNRKFQARENEPEDV